MRILQAKNEDDKDESIFMKLLTLPVHTVTSRLSVQPDARAFAEFTS